MSQKDRQSQIKYVFTQRDIERRTGQKIRCPIRVFDLEGIGIDRLSFLRDLRPSFERLAWDLYDAKREQVMYLMARFPAERARLATFKKRYEAGEVELYAVKDLLEQLDHFQTEEFEAIRSYRRRSIARFQLFNRGNGNWFNQWQLRQVEVGAFTQDVNDDRAAPRIFDPTAEEVVRHPQFRRLLVAIAEMVEDCEVGGDLEIDELDITFHQMGLVTHTGVATTNAPEGLHKDGADYIVSALVVERSDSVQGGKSIIKDETGEELLSWTLEPGQGILQADARSRLWHDVTPIFLQPTDGHDGSAGVRNIFGFDINVRRRPRTT